MSSPSLGGWQSSELGFDVLPGETVSVRLADSSGVRLWELAVIGTDELVAAPTITQAGVVTGTATFTAPSSPTEGWALVIQSQVGFNALGFDRYDVQNATYTGTFGVFRRTAEGLRLGAENEIYEGSAEWAWTIKINELIRRAPATGTGVSSGRTLFGTSPIRIDGVASGDLSANRTISIAPGSVSGQVLGWDGAAWVARQVVVLTGLTVSTLGLGVVHSSAGGVFSSSLIVNADVDPAAGIVVSKLGQSGATTGQAVVWNGSTWAPGTVTASGVTPGTARQIYFTNATPLAEWTTASGDVSVPTTAGVFRVDRINGTAVTTAGGGAVGSVLRMTGAATSDWGAVDLADADAVTGLMAVTRIAPSVTNGQFLSTTGGVATWSAVTNASIAPGAANTVLTTNAGATATAWALLVNANVDPAAGIVVTKLSPGAINTILITDGTGAIVWSTGVPGTGTLAGDVTGPTSANVVERVHGATVPIAGALVTGQVLQVSGASALTYGTVGTAGITPGAANTVLTTNGAGTATAWATIVNANVSASAAIAVSKLAAASLQYQVLTAGVAGAPQWGQVNLSSTDAITGLLPVANIAPGAPNTVLITNGSSAVVWSATLPGSMVTLAGDVTGPASSNVVVRINGATVPVSGALLVGNVLQVTGVSALGYAPVNLAGGVNFVVNALPLVNIAQGGAVANDVLRWNGTVWDPEPIGNLLPPSATTVQIVADMPALEALPVTPLANRVLCIVQTPTRIYWLDKGATPAASGDDELPPANGGGAWRFKEAA